jgi:hypothetical protein
MYLRRILFSLLRKILFSLLRKNAYRLRRRSPGYTPSCDGVWCAADAWSLAGRTTVRNSRFSRSGSIGRTIEAADRLGDAPVIRPDHLAQVLGVHAGRQRRRADEIAKHPWQAERAFMMVHRILRRQLDVLDLF